VIGQILVHFSLLLAGFMSNYAKLISKFDGEMTNSIPGMDGAAAIKDVLHVLVNGTTTSQYPPVLMPNHAPTGISNRYYGFKQLYKTLKTY